MYCDHCGRWSSRSAPCELRVETRSGHVDDSGKVSKVLKPTRWLSTSECLVKRLTKKCPGEHQHATLLGGKKTRAAAIYPPELCRQILLGVQDQLQAEGRPLGPHLGSLMKSSILVYDLSNSPHQSDLEMRPEEAECYDDD